ncbi:MAG: hypothetical protein MZW92_35465 [Comamonadaceae bacterium]|nr:hypothetical protein [Comamonadaceae bacterium]
MAQLLRPAAAGHAHLRERHAPAYLRTHPLTVERISDMQNRAPARRACGSGPTRLDFTLTRARLRVLQDPTAQGARDCAGCTSRSQLDATAPRPPDGRALRPGRWRSMRLDEHAARARGGARRRAVWRAGAVADARQAGVAERCFAAAQRRRAEREAAMRHGARCRGPLSAVAADGDATTSTLLQRDEQHEAAVAYLRDQLAMPRSDPRYYSSCSRAATRALGQRTLQHQAAAEAVPAARRRCRRRSSSCSWRARASGRRLLRDVRRSTRGCASSTQQSAASTARNWRASGQRAARRAAASADAGALARAIAPARAGHRHAGGPDERPANRRESRLAPAALAARAAPFGKTRQDGYHRDQPAADVHRTRRGQAARSRPMR